MGAKNSWHLRKGGRYLQILELLRECIENEGFIGLELTGRRNRDVEYPEKVSVRPISVRGELSYQITRHFARKATQANLKSAETLSKISELLPEFRQGRLFTPKSDYLLITNKRGEVQIQSSPPTRLPIEATHDRKKTYLLPENQPCDFLIRLGVMRPDGKVLANRYDKFRQINRFLEIFADAIPDLPEGPLHIVEFGCGKSYLTFAIYYYLRQTLKREATITGLDLKPDVVAHCESLARELNYEGLSFSCGEIRAFQTEKPVDMMVSLHACDTATDDALAQAIAWQTKAILCVPCCQHELFRQLNNELMRPLLKHGILKERLTALITDAIRGERLEQAGYSVQILEFIETEHTAKNLLIRAIRKPGSLAAPDASELEAFRAFWLGGRENMR